MLIDAGANIDFQENKVRIITGYKLAIMCQYIFDNVSINDNMYSYSYDVTYLSENIDKTQILLENKIK